VQKAGCTLVRNEMTARTLFFQSSSKNEGIAHGKHERVSS
jgi:hypothetical protein